MSGVATAIQLNDVVSGPLLHITNALNMTISTFESLDTEMNGAFNTGAFDSVRAEIEMANREMEAMASNITENTSGQNQFNNELQKGTNHADGLAKKVVGAVAAYASIKTAGSVLNLSDELTQTTARLDMMNDGLQSTDKLQNMIFTSAQRSRGAYQATADAVSKLGMNAKDAFSSSSETVAFAEQLNKQFVIAGTEAGAAQGATTQLVQALGSGALRGDELNSVFEAAPTIIQSIADYMDQPIGKIKDLASEGKITSDIVKNSLLAAADETNRKFDEMPMTFGQIWTSVKNKALMEFQPVLNKISEIGNSAQFTAFVDGFTSTFATLSKTVLNIFDLMLQVGSVIADNWSWIAPIIGGVVFALGAYEAAVIANNIVEGISNTLKTIAAISSVVHGTATAAEAAATCGATEAQLAFNAALLSSPLTWIILILIAVIAVIYAVVAAINKFTGSSISATGVIIGAFAVLGAFIWNTIVGVINAIIQFLWTRFVEPFIGIIEWILNVVNGGFDSFGGAVANLIGQIISWFLSLGKVVTKIIDAIFGTDWTSGLETLQDNVLAWGKNEDAITIDRSAPEIDSRIDYGDAWDTGYGAGANIEKNIKDALNKANGAGDAANQTELDYTTTDNIADTAKNTKDIKDSLDMTSEDLKYLKELAEQKIINRFTTAEIKVEMNNSNSINSKMDIDGVINSLTTEVEEAMQSAAEGVH